MYYQRQIDNYTHLSAKLFVEKTNFLFLSMDALCVRAVAVPIDNIK
jgi:hypothetical protein